MSNYGIRSCLAKSQGSVPKASALARARGQATWPGLLACLGAVYEGTCIIPHVPGHKLQKYPCHMVVLLFAKPNTCIRVCNSLSDSSWSSFKSARARILCQNCCAKCSRVAASVEMRTSPACNKKEKKKTFTSVNACNAFES